MPTDAPWKSAPDAPGWYVQKTRRGARFLKLEEWELEFHTPIEGFAYFGPLDPTGVASSVDALAFYGRTMSYDACSRHAADVIIDRGKRARKALAVLREETK